LQSLHRVREHWLIQRTAVINQTRSLLLEARDHLAQGRCHLETALSGIIEDATAKLSSALRILLTQMKLELDQLVLRIEEADARIKQVAQENEACRRLVAIPGVGPVTATVLIAATGNGAASARAGNFSLDRGCSSRILHRGQAKASGHQQAWQPLSPKAFRAGRQGARSVMMYRTKQSSGLSQWLESSLCTSTTT
jgi:transposase